MPVSVVPPGLGLVLTRLFPPMNRWAILVTSLWDAKHIRRGEERTRRGEGADAERHRSHNHDAHQRTLSSNMFLAVHFSMPPKIRMTKDGVVAVRSVILPLRCSVRRPRPRPRSPRRSPRRGPPPSLRLSVASRTSLKRGYTAPPWVRIIPERHDQNRGSHLFARGAGTP